MTPEITMGDAVVAVPTSPWPTATHVVALGQANWDNEVRVIPTAVPAAQAPVPTGPLTTMGAPPLAVVPMAAHPVAPDGQTRLDRDVVGSVTTSATQLSLVAPMVPISTAPATPVPDPVVPMATHWVDVGQTTWVNEVTAAPDTVGTVSAVSVGDEPVVACRITAPPGPYPTPMHAVVAAQVVEVNRVSDVPPGSEAPVQLPLPPDWLSQVNPALAELF